MKLPQLPADKANHFLYGALIAALGSVAASPLVGAGLCVGFAVAKEVADRVTKKGNPELADALATVAGGAAVVLPQVLPKLVGVVA